MKKYVEISLSLSLIALLLTGCLDENNKSDVLYQDTPGTIRISGSITYIELDFLEVNLYPTNLAPAFWEDGDRVSVTFRIDQSKQSGDKYWDDVSLLDIYKIPRKEIIEYSSDSVYSNDPITEIQKKWITDNVLNFDIQFSCTNADKHKHTFDLIYDPSQLKSQPDMIVLTLNHNAFGDTESSSNERLYYSFSLDKVIPFYEGKDSVVLKIEANALNPEKSEYVVYKFKR